MKISLGSQSLFAFPLDKAIEVTREIGFSATELVCDKPHFDLAMARVDSQRVVQHMEQAGLAVSALSLVNTFTNPENLEDQIEAAETFMRLAPLFGTKTVKLTPGQPGSAEATLTHWRCLENAIERLAPVARELGVRIAFETHMRQLTDTLASSKRLMEIAGSDVVGLTVDFSNLAFAGEKMSEVISVLANYIYNTHIKNGYINTDGSWHFQALDEGLTDYALVLRMLRDINYDGYLTIECLGAEAREKPVATAQRDLKTLKRYVEKIENDTQSVGGVR